MDSIEYVCGCGRISRRETDRVRHEKTCTKRRVATQRQGFRVTAASATSWRLDGRRSPSTAEPPHSHLHVPVQYVPPPGERPHYPFLHVHIPSDESFEEKQELSSDSGEEQAFIDLIGDDGEDAEEYSLSGLEIATDAELQAFDDDEPPNASSTSEVTYEQMKAARFIITSGPSDKGLSQHQTGAYIASLHRRGTVRSLWKSGQVFWKDHSRRQKAVFAQVGKWSKYSIATSKPEVAKTDALIRDLPTTLQNLISNASRIELEDGTGWEDHLQMSPGSAYDANRCRILSDWYTADDM